MDKLDEMLYDKLGAALTYREPFSWSNDSHEPLMRPLLEWINGDCEKLAYLLNYAYDKGELYAFECVQSDIREQEKEVLRYIIASSKM
jgi:hypothetical protein